MDFTDDEKRLRIKSLHPGVSVDQVQENTGFELAIPEVVRETELPTQAELKVLRERVDPQGLLR
jgi:acyl CoA:acetate/3-ketoacid CoA transferase beta subunit